MQSQAQHMAVDQYGQMIHNLGPHPRKALLERLGYKKSTRMFRDDPLTGEVRHVGYVIGDRWLAVYTVARWGRVVS